MTAIAFGAAALANDTPIASSQSASSQLPISQSPALPKTALPVTPIRFGEQLRQSLGADVLSVLPVAARGPNQAATADDLALEQLATTDEEEVSEALPTFPGLITFTQPIAVPLEYAQRSSSYSQQQSQAAQPIATVSQLLQPAVSRDQPSLSVLAAIPETSALGAMTINAATMSLVSKATSAALAAENQSALPVTQLASLTNAGLAQALVEGMTQQPGVLAPVAAQQAQSLNTQRSALEVALGDRLQLQITQRSEHAVIRLDPPSMGSIEIVIQREAGTIQVHLRASHPEVARQLQGIGDSLRQDLIHRQNGDVSVHVSDSSREQYANQQGQRQSQSQSQREQPGRALSESNEESARTFTLAVDEERGA
ncbi:flagellar hook-length control protein FliK [Steroidobacter sp.]|uniref:flagellar hook-length control protein FliK n=1 Tax=Steroidobacter sp. TaxID=1978227 RepID=UPI001A505854|nr:flagellar hook-length control protein FliK [Steroidobacter sp.]MBL8265475.1 flagellar hook-length control protein FliK [Steroidobacter sp.]